MSLSKTRQVGGGRKMRLAAAIAIVAAVFTGTLATAAPAQAAGDVCDICSINFDLGACESLGGYPYDSTLEDPPAAITAGNKAPAANQPKAPAAPTKKAPAAQPSAPKSAPAAKSTTSTSTSGSNSTTGGAAKADTAVAPATVATVVPQQPSGLQAEVSGRTLSLAWDAPAASDGIDAYKLVLNGGTPIELPAGETSYAIDLGTGSYEVELLASNSAGDSVAAVAPIEVVIESASGDEPNVVSGELLAENAEALSTDGDQSQLIAGIALGVLVFAGTGALLWWSLRRKKQHPEATQE